MKPSITLIADNRGSFADFGEVVPSVRGDGRVVFAARTRDGLSGVFAGYGEGCVPIVARPGLEIDGHPDQDEAGRVVFYAREPGGPLGLWRVAEGELARITPEGVAEVGPLGPTMSAGGDIGARVLLTGGAQALLHLGSRAELVADSRQFSSFHGLPLACEDGGLIFRADTSTGGGLYQAQGGQLRPLLELGGDFVALGRFPALDPGGGVVFAGVTRQGGSGVFRLRDGAVTPLLDESSSALRDFRGVLSAGDGRVVYYASDTRGSLGIYLGPDPAEDRLLGLNDPWSFSSVVDLALNPVSCDPSGRVAIRLRLGDGRQQILRVDGLRSWVSRST